MRRVEAFAIAAGPTSTAPVFKGSDDGLATSALAYALRAAMGAGMVLDAGARLFVDGPNIVSVSRRPVAG